MRPIRPFSSDLDETSGTTAYDAPLSIGSRQSGNGTAYDDQFIWNIDDVSIYGYALSQSQVLAHYYASGIAPVISMDPTNTTVNLGDNAYFYVSASGSPPLTYRWFDITSGTPMAQQYFRVRVQ